MIRKILTYYAERLEEYLSRTHRRPEGLATVGMIGNSAEERPNKMVVSLLNVERHSPRAAHRRRRVCPPATAPVAQPQRDVGGGVRRASVPQWNNT